MHLIEFDNHVSQTSYTLETLDYGIQRLPEGNVEIMLEYSEELFGLGFVCLQTYVAATLADLKIVFPTRVVTRESRRRKKTCRVQPGEGDAGSGKQKPTPTSYSPEDIRKASPLLSCGESSIDVIWAAANYYKHHDDWQKHWFRDDWPEDWRPDNNTKTTILLLERLRITPKTDQPCLELLDFLLGGDERRLTALLDLAVAWRESWFSRLHKKTEENASAPSNRVLATTGSKT